MFWDKLVILKTGFLSKLEALNMKFKGFVFCKLPDSLPVDGVTLVFISGCFSCDEPPLFTLFERKRF